MARRQGTVNGVFCPDILVDTGATQTVVRKELVTDDDILDGEVTIQCAHGDTASYPLAVVKINIEGNDIITTAAVSSTLPASVLLGWDVPQLMNFVGKESPQSDGKEVEGALVVTRLQQTQPQPDSYQPEPTGEDDQSGDARATSTPTTPTLEDQAQDNYLLNLDDSLFPPAGPHRTVMTRAQKREDRRRYRVGLTANAQEYAKLNIASRR